MEKEEKGRVEGELDGEVAEEGTGHGAETKSEGLKVTQSRLSEDLSRQLETVKSLLTDVGESEKKCIKSVEMKIATGRASEVNYPRVIERHKRVLHGELVRMRAGAAGKEAHAVARKLTEIGVKGFEEKGSGLELGRQDSVFREELGGETTGQAVMEHEKGGGEPGDAELDQWLEGGERQADEEAEWFAKERERVDEEMAKLGETEDQKIKRKAADEERLGRSKRERAEAAAAMIVERGTEAAANDEIDDDVNADATKLNIKRKNKKKNKNKSRKQRAKQPLDTNKLLTVPDIATSNVTTIHVDTTHSFESDIYAAAPSLAHTRVDTLTPGEAAATTTTAQPTPTRARSPLTTVPLLLPATFVPSFRAFVTANESTVKDFYKSLEEEGRVWTKREKELLGQLDVFVQAGRTICDSEQVGRMGLELGRKKAEERMGKVKGERGGGEEAG